MKVPGLETLGIQRGLQESGGGTMGAWGPSPPPQGPKQSGILPPLGDSVQTHLLGVSRSSGQDVLRVQARPSSPGQGRELQSGRTELPPRLIRYRSGLRESWGVGRSKKWRQGEQSLALPQEKSVLGFPGGAVVKNPPANAGDVGSIPGLGRSHMPCSN